MRLLALLAIVGLAFFGVREWRQHQREDRLSAIASELAGRSVDVSCEGFFGRALDLGTNAGSVHFDAQGRPSDTAELKGDTCDDLIAFAGRRTDPRFACVYREEACPVELERTILSLLVLAHESAHLAGVRSEAEAQCRAVQQVSLVAERLGSPANEAHAIARHFLAVQQPRVDDAYRLPAGCADGGPLDVTAAPGWPSP